MKFRFSLKAATVPLNKEKIHIFRLMIFVYILCNRNNLSKGSNAWRTLEYLLPNSGFKQKVIILAYFGNVVVCAVIVA